MTRAAGEISIVSIARPTLTLARPLRGRTEDLHAAFCHAVPQDRAGEDYTKSEHRPSERPPASSGTTFKPFFKTRFKNRQGLIAIGQYRHSALVLQEHRRKTADAQGSGPGEVSGSFILGGLIGIGREKCITVDRKFFGHLGKGIRIVRIPIECVETRLYLREIRVFAAWLKCARHDEGATGFLGVINPAKIVQDTERELLSCPRATL